MRGLVPWVDAVFVVQPRCLSLGQGADGYQRCALPALVELDHIQPRSRGGSDRVSNLALSCHACNVAKGDQTAAEFAHPEVAALAKQPLRDAAAVNATRWMRCAWENWLESAPPGTKPLRSKRRVVAATAAPMWMTMASRWAT
jgi:hypothetical protein